MDKKSISIEEQINSSGLKFKGYLKKSLNEEVVNLLEVLSKKCNVFIFSGIIRNFFLNITENRDVDFFLDGDVDIENILGKTNLKKNSFGGYKINLNNIVVDFWLKKNTWALNFQPILEFESAKYIPYTAFFNFSSIIYSYNEEKFYYTKYFTEFLSTQKLDLVYAPNANYALCIVNTFYYSEKFNLKISKKLKNFIKKIYQNNINSCESAQIKHFGKILYTTEQLNNKIKSFNA